MKQNNTNQFQWSLLSLDKQHVNQQPIPNQSFYYHHFFKQLLQFQSQVNTQLFINRVLTDKFLNQNRATAKTFSSQASTAPTFNEKSSQSSLKPSSKKVNEPKIKNKNRMKSQYMGSEQSSNYEPSDEQEVLIQYKLSESKNVPKNYSKSILAFVRKHQNFWQSILSDLGQNYEQFKQYVSKLKNNINTILQLRSLWIESPTNPFAKILRILTFIYLRKHSLSHTFNSRVESFGKHIKYRQKILEAIKNPEEFTQMKDF